MRAKKMFELMKERNTKLEMIQDFYYKGLLSIEEYGNLSKKYFEIYSK